MFFRIGVLKNIAIFTGKHLCWSLLLKKSILKKRLQHRSFPVNIAKFLRTPFLQNTSGWLFLLGMIHIWRPWKLSNFQDPPPPLSINVQNSSIPLTLDVQFQTNPLPVQMITNQLKENVIQGWLLCYQILPSGRHSFSVSTH